MDSLFGFNEIDAVILGIIFLSGIFAYIRGFSWEVLSLLSWILTLVAVWYLSWASSPWTNALMVSYFGWSLPYFVVVGITALIVFLAMTMILGPLTTFIMKGSINMRLSFMDRFLGFCYGALRGFLLAAGLFFIYTYFFLEEEYLQGLKDARFYMSLQEVIEIFKDIFSIENNA